MSKKVKLVIILNIFIPLIAGFLIYVFLKNGTYISSFLNGLRFNFYLKVPDNLFFYVLKNWACDFFWSYALMFSLYFALSGFKYKLLLSATSAFILGLLLEFLQRSGLINGTFDLYDIATEVSALFLSIIILKGVQKK